MVFFFFFLTSGGLCLTCPLPVILTNAFVVNCFVLGHFAEVISAKAAKQNVSAVLSCKQDVSAVLF